MKERSATWTWTLHGLVATCCTCNVEKGTMIERKAGVNIFYILLTLPAAYIICYSGYCSGPSSVRSITASGFSHSLDGAVEYYESPDWPSRKDTSLPALVPYARFTRLVPLHNAAIV